MKNLFFFVSLSAVLFGCSAPTEQGGDESEPITENTFAPPSINDTVIRYDRIGFSSEVRIKAPESNFKGTILVLQGWNFPNTSWSDSSNLELLASEAGFYLIMPEMGKSIYQKQNYPQTRKDWQKYPTRTWLVDTLISDLQKKYNLFTDYHSNFVMGLSTGGRGAFILAQENPDIFDAGASLSGDYDPSAYPGDNLYRGFFGFNAELWNDEENPLSYADNWSVPMYFSHGAADSIVPVRHQLLLEEFAQNYPQTENWIFKINPEAGHNYPFWSEQTSEIIRFFSEKLK